MLCHGDLHIVTDASLQEFSLICVPHILCYLFHTSIGQCRFLLW